ncbi:MAG: discoidin domain-containing protein [Candidatus Omnitrophota bacterium]|nr:discoidin domain-containing protein [Candidatus Omnitrophota bacterium]
MKKRLFFIPIIILILGFIYACRPLPVRNELTIKEVTASSELGGNKPANAVDSNYETRWESVLEDNQWIQVEFNAPVDLYGIGIKWETAAAYRYAVLSSNDGKAWKALAAIDDGNEGEFIRINFKEKTRCKFIKIDCIERVTQWGFSIWEMELKADKPYESISPRRLIPRGSTFFSVKKENDKYWLIDPDGKLFISKGVNVVSPEDGAVLPKSDHYDVSSKYKNPEEWALDAISRLKKWNFNTIGSWSDVNTFYYDTPFTYILYIPTGGDHRLVDVFDPEFKETAEKIISHKCKRFKNSRYLIGYFIDNELPWYGDWGWYTGHAPTLLDEYAKLPKGSPGKVRLIEFFKALYENEIQRFNSVWGKDCKTFEEIGDIDAFSRAYSKETKEARESFAGIVAEEYFSVTAGYIKKYDPNHLILGVRFAGNAPEAVITASGKYCDVISINYYCKSMVFDKQLFDNFFLLGQKPLMITEFSYRAMENRSGDKNTAGADVTVATQNDRKVGYNKYVSQAMEFPYMVGYHWFEYFDQSPQGRSFDGENSNYGIVDIYDNEYELLTAEMARVNSEAEKIHQDSVAPFPDKLFKTNEYVGVNNKDIKRESAPFCDIDRIEIQKLTVWLDASSEASIKFYIEQSTEGKKFIKSIIDTGKGWGCGVGILPEIENPNNDKTADLQGFTGIKVKMAVTKDMPFNLFINESGVDALGKEKYNGVNGADGESFNSETYVGTGNIEEYDYPFNLFKLRNVYGNQGGNKTLDLQAIRNIDLYFPGNSGAGECDIYGINLY